MTDSDIQKRKLETEKKFLLRTPSEEIGPMYPVHRPEARGSDLALTKTGKRLAGQPLYIRGTVMDLTGQIIAGAEVELWHADPHGRYPHPSDLNPAALDPDFTGHGVAVTGTDGVFSFRSTKPAAYPTSTPGWWRPPHLHFQVTTQWDRLVTQMYFPDEELNEKDELLARHRRLNQADRVQARALPLEVGMELDALHLVFNIVLPTPHSISAFKAR